MTQQTILINLEGQMTPIRADVNGAFAIHHACGLHRQTRRMVKRWDYALTHINTGRVIYRSMFRDSLEGLQAELETVMDWNALTPENYAALSDDVKVRCVDIIDRWHVRSAAVA